MKKYLIGIFSVFIWVAVIVSSFRVGRKYGYEEGMSNMFYFSFDTMQNILNQQVRSDSTVTKLRLEHLEHLDTVTFLLNKKIVEDGIKRK